jgi:hypothetical protein
MFRHFVRRLIHHLIVFLVRCMQLTVAAPAPCRIHRRYLAGDVTILEQHRCSLFFLLPDHCLCPVVTSSAMVIACLPVVQDLDVEERPCKVRKEVDVSADLTVCLSFYLPSHVFSCALQSGLSRGGAGVVAMPEYPVPRDPTEEDTLMEAPTLRPLRVEVDIIRLLLLIACNARFHVCYTDPVPIRRPGRGTLSLGVTSCESGDGLQVPRRARRSSARLG